VIAFLFGVSMEILFVGSVIMLLKVEIIFLFLM
jgi:hypothetical protein